VYEGASVVEIFGNSGFAVVALQKLRCLAVLVETG